MSLLEGLVAQVIKSSLGTQNTNAQPQARQSTGALEDLLGSVLGGQATKTAGLDAILGQLAGQSSGNNHVNAGLGGMLGGLLGSTQKSGSLGAGDIGSLLGSLLGGQKQSGGFDKRTLLLALLPVVLGFIQKNGGLSGVLSKFNQSGMGNKVQSWVNLDTNNDGIDAADVVRLFGSDEIGNICQQTGADEAQVCQGIAELLPKVVDDLTPHGDVAADEVVANQEIGEMLAKIAQ